MKSDRTRTSSLTRTLSTLLLALLAAGSLTAQQTVSLRADFWYPYNGDPADPKPGYEIEILRAIFQKGGGKLDYQVMPWKRAVAEAEKGTIHGVIGALKSDTPDFIFPEEPMGVSQNGVFVKKGAGWAYKDVDSLKGKKIGIINGYTYGEKLDAYIAANKQSVDESSGDTPTEMGIRKLAGGRIDVFIENRTVFLAQVAKLGLKIDDFEDLGSLSDPEPLYVSFSPKKEESKTLATKLTEGIRELRASGELAKILAKYAVSDWAK